MHSSSRHAARSPQQGFTLMEILVVLAIVALLSGLVGPQVLKSLGGAKTKTADIQLGDLDQALEMYKLDVGRFPNTEQGLEALVTAPAGVKGWNGPYLKVKKGQLPLDPWEQPYQYKQPGDHGTFDLMSLGEDGATGGEGEAADITNWE